MRGVPAEPGPPDTATLGERLSLTEIIRLQELLSKALVRRFEQRLALAFSDIVGSTAYCARFGNEAGRKLQQRHLDLVEHALPRGQGRVVDTAGDGAFLCFPSVDGAVQSLTELQRSISADNAGRASDHQLRIRIGLHFGAVLTDGELVTGDPVNSCARVAESAQPGEIRLTREAFRDLGDARKRLLCRPLPPAEIAEMDRFTAELLVLEWRDRSVFPGLVRIEGGPEMALPEQDLISFGRLREQDGVPANDIVLECADGARTRQISRWHFELRRHPDGFRLRALSDSETEVDGRSIARGEEVAVRPGTKVRVGGVLSLELVSRTSPEPLGGEGTVTYRRG